MRERVLTIGLAVLAACGPGGGGEVDVAPGESTDTSPAEVERPVLASSLEAQVGPDSVGLTLSVTNPGDAPVVLESSTAQQYDFVITGAGGDEVWRWSADRMFAQVVTVDTVAAGSTRTYQASWAHEGRSGEYTLVGALTSTNQSLELTTRFAVPAR